ncbi:MAG: GDP-mannose 4,6-dehydratase [Planctomycetota bacterium]|jgi:GDPmannose 4,6-dehydratase|nr:GDP-mannose 4,6-dehydratase [Planctomycetota bacterium]
MDEPNLPAGERRALITGITGQDGSYLAEFLLGLGYQVYGLLRRSSSPRLDRVEHLRERIHFVGGDLLDQSSLVRALQEARPREVYNLAAQSFVPTSFAEPVHTAEVNAVGVVRLLEALRQVAPEARMYQASTSEMFGKVVASPQDELTPFYPRSPYGVSKVYAHWAVVNHREAFDLFTCSGILFNHESPRRGEEFVTQKVAGAVARIERGLASEVVLGNLEARRDWGHAADYVRGMWAMLQCDEPDDFVIATGTTRSVADLCEAAFACIGRDWRDHVRTDPAFIRPADVELLVGDASKARRELGWEPEICFENLISEMVEARLAALDA